MENKLLNLSDPEKKEYIKLQLQILWNEILFRREREFKTLDRIGLLLVVVIGFLLTDNGKSVINNCNIKWIMIIGISLVVYLSIHFLFENANRHRSAAKVISNISENIMGFHEKGLYIENQQVFPDEWKKFGTFKSIFYIQIAIIIVLYLLGIFLLIYRSTI